VVVVVASVLAMAPVLVLVVLVVVVGGGDSQHHHHHRLRRRGSRRTNAFVNWSGKLRALRQTWRPQQLRTCTRSNISMAAASVAIAVDVVAEHP
jgi:hypothetical protein